MENEIIQVLVSSLI